jgi:ankyrin repeat protein
MTELHVGHTALHIAFANSHLETAEMLVSRGAVNSCRPKCRRCELNLKALKRRQSRQSAAKQAPQPFRAPDR